MKKLTLFTLLISFFCGYSQSNFKSFKKLSKSKKRWVIWHPFKAKKALLISNEAIRMADSIQKKGLLHGDSNGGQIDAFRHAYWMARLHQEIGKNAARSLGKAHEKDNYLTFKKHKLEDGVIPDEISSKMDLFNNEVGLTLSRKKEKISKKILVYRTINAIQQGRMLVIKKDKNGFFLTCNGVIITEKSLKGRWKNNKCLIPSDLI